MSGPPALLLLIQKHAPRRYAFAADGMRLRKIDLAELAGFADAVQIGAVAPESVLIADGQLLSRPLCGIEHLFRLRGVDRHGFLAQDVLPRLERRYRDLSVGIVGRQNMNLVDGSVREQFPVIRAKLCAGSPVFLRRLFRPLGNDIAKRRQLAVASEF